jgi:nucleoside-diphosphate-sugar epimerase
VIGDLADPAGLAGPMRNADAVIHAAYDPAGESARRDRDALGAVREAVQDGRVRKVIYTSGIWVHGDTGGRVVDETARPEPAERVAWRPAHEEVALDMTSLGATVVVMRPGMVYGGARGWFGGWFREARDHGRVSYPGGPQRWNMVHVDDVAAAYWLALEHATDGARYLLVDETRHTVQELAHAAAAAAGATAIAVPPEEVLRRHGALGAAMLCDSMATAAKARRELGWTPLHASFVAEAGALWEAWQAEMRAPVA